MPNGITKEICTLIRIRKSRVGTKVGPPLPCLSDGYHVFLGNHDLDFLKNENFKNCLMEFLKFKICTLIFIRKSRVGTKVGPPLPCLSDGYHVFLGNHDLDDTLIMILTFFLLNSLIRYQLLRQSKKSGVKLKLS